MSVERFSMWMRLGSILFHQVFSHHIGFGIILHSPLGPGDDDTGLPGTLQVGEGGVQPAAEASGKGNPLPPCSPHHHSGIISRGLP